MTVLYVLFINMHDDFAQPFIAGELDRCDAVPAGSTESPPGATVEQGGGACMDARDQHQMMTRKFIYANGIMHEEMNAFSIENTTSRGPIRRLEEDDFPGNSCYFTRLGQFANLRGLAVVTKDSC